MPNSYRVWHMSAGQARSDISQFGDSRSRLLLGARHNTRESWDVLGTALGSAILRIPSGSTVNSVCKSGCCVKSISSIRS